MNTRGQRTRGRRERKCSNTSEQSRIVETDLTERRSGRSPVKENR